MDKNLLKNLLKCGTLSFLNLSSLGCSRSYFSNFLSLINNQASLLIRFCFIVKWTPKSIKSFSFSNLLKQAVHFSSYIKLCYDLLSWLKQYLSHNYNFKITKISVDLSDTCTCTCTPPSASPTLWKMYMYMYVSK